MPIPTTGPHLCWLASHSECGMYRGLHVRHPIGNPYFFEELLTLHDCKQVVPNRGFSQLQSKPGEER